MKLNLCHTIAAMSALLLAGFANADGTPSGKQQLFADANGTVYGCTPGSQTAGQNLSRCNALVAAVVNQIKAGSVKVPQFPAASTLPPSGTAAGTSSGSSSGSGSADTGGDDVDTESTKVSVSTPQGILTCPVTAFSADKTLDPSACSPAGSSAEDAKVVCIPPVSATPLGAPTSSTGSTTSTGTTGSTSTTGSTGTTGSTVTTGAAAATTLVCSMPGETYSKNPLPKTKGACPGGGTRTLVGGYDTKAGTVDITVTMTNCIDEQGNTHNGTASMQGTLVPTTSTSVADPASTYDMNETKAISTTVTFKSGGQVARQCTITRVGTYDDKNGKFNGTVTRNNCTLTGDYKFRPGLVDNLIENASEVEPI